MSYPIKTSNLHPNGIHDKPPAKPVIPEKDKKIKAYKPKTSEDGWRTPSPISRRVSKSPLSVPRMTERLLGKHIENDEKKENELIKRQPKIEETNFLSNRQKQNDSIDEDFLNQLTQMSEPLIEREKAGEKKQESEQKVKRTKLKASSQKIGREAKGKASRRTRSIVGKNVPGKGWRPGLGSIDE